MNESLQIVFGLAFAGCMLCAMASDYGGFRIPNSISITLAGLFTLYALLGGVAALWPHLLLAGLVFLTLFIFFVLGWIGAGDVKFLTAVTLWTGPAHSANFMILFAVFSGAFALFLLALRSVQAAYPAVARLPLLDRLSRWARNGICPYAIPIGAAALGVAPSIFLGA